MKNVNSVFELKRTNLNGLKSINGIKVSNLGLDITNSSVSMYSVEKQGDIYFQSPFNLEF